MHTNMNPALIRKAMRDIYMSIANGTSLVEIRDGIAGLYDVPVMYAEGMVDVVLVLKEKALVY